jgi:hypothetical protein
VNTPAIFNPDRLAELLDPFAPGMSEHITPIKYEVLTPDLSCFLFRTTGKNGQNYYFVHVEYDHIRDLQTAKDIIKQWHGEVIEFLPPDNPEPVDEGGLADVSHRYDKIYLGLLARVGRPGGKGFWATEIIIKPDSDIKAAIAHLGDRRQAAIEKDIAAIRAKHPNSVISVYSKSDGFELFFSFSK